MSAPEDAGRKSNNHGTRRVLHITFVVLGFFLLWQTVVDAARIPEYLLPAPSAIFAEIGSAPNWYLMHVARTVGATLLGFSAALVVGYIAAVAIVYSRILEDTLFTLLIAMNSVPKVALAPIFIIWMGTGLSSKSSSYRAAHGSNRPSYRTASMSAFPAASRWRKPSKAHPLSPSPPPSAHRLASRSSWSVIRRSRPSPI
jgi:hypothetical protein